MIPYLEADTGMLPPGRHVCTPHEVELAFVKDMSFFGSSTRPGLWDDWNNALAILTSAVTVHAAWLGGSFTTAKMDPDDIDVTFIISGADLRKRDTRVLRHTLGMSAGACAVRR